MKAVTAPAYEGPYFYEVYDNEEQLERFLKDPISAYQHPIAIYPKDGGLVVWWETVPDDEDDLYGEKANQ